MRFAESDIPLSGRQENIRRRTFFKKEKILPCLIKGSIAFSGVS